MISIHSITDQVGFESLESIWNPLLQSSEADTFFLSWEYQSQWWKTFGDQFEMRILVATDLRSNQIVGIAPLMTGFGHTTARKALRHLSFIGQLSETSTDYGDFIIRMGREEEVMAEFVKVMGIEMAEDWSLLYLPTVRRDSSCIKHMLNLLEGMGMAPNAIHDQPSYYARIAPDWETYLNSLGSKARRNIRRSIRKLEANYEVEVLTAGSSVGLDEALDWTIQLNQNRWGAEGESFHTPAFNQFHRDLAQTLLQSDQLGLKVLRLDGKLAAVQYDFIYGANALGFQAGWEPDFADLRVSAALQAYAIQDYLEQGVTEYDFLPGDSFYKKQWTTDQREVFDVEISNPRSLKGKLFGLVRKLREGVQIPLREVA